MMDSLGSNQPNCLGSARWQSSPHRHNGAELMRERVCEFAWARMGSRLARIRDLASGGGDLEKKKTRSIVIVVVVVVVVGAVRWPIWESS